MRDKRSWLIGASAAVLLAVGAVAVLPRFASRVQQTAATYYCPMHPTYVSDRPGDCPICNMRLVKREAGEAAAVATSRNGHTNDAQTVSPMHSICYLHNCPKLHAGKPCPMTVVAKPGEQVTCPICGTHIAEAATPPSERNILYWTDPMLPGYKADKPGQSPMGMDLVPVYEEEAGAPMGGDVPPGYAPVMLTPQKQQLIGVRTDPVVRRQMTKTIRSVGRIAYDPELYQAQQEYLQALKAAQRADTGTIPEIRDQSRRLVDSSRMRLRLLGLSDELIDEMADWEGPDRSLLLADPGKQVWLYVTIYEYELPSVRIGQTVRVELAAIPGKALEGTIRSIDPVLNPQTRSARVRATLTDPEGMLRPEMYVNATIQIDAGDVLAVPREAVFSTGTKHLVFVDLGQGLFEPRDVVLGVETEGSVEIRQGLTADERVVTSGNFLIDSESRLKAALEGMGQAGHQHGQ